MTPKEKAEELVDKLYQLFPLEVDIFSGLGDLSYEDNMIKVKGCALICCDEVLGYMGADRGYEFWTSVKQEIDKL